MVLLVNLLGCVGTGKRKKSYLFFYFVFQAILMILEIGGGVVAILYSSNADEVIYTGWLDAAPETVIQVQVFDFLSWYSFFPL